MKTCEKYVRYLGLKQMLKCNNYYQNLLLKSYPSELLRQVANRSTDFCIHSVLFNLQAH